jgi:hypothetical protein
MILSRRAVSRRRLVVYAVIFVLLVAVAATVSPALLGAAAVGLVVYVVYVMTLGAALSARKLRKSLSQERCHTFSDEAAVTESATGSSRTAWSNFTEIRDLDAFFVFITTGRTWMIVPRQAFESARDVDSFRALATRRIAESAIAPDAI